MYLISNTETREFFKLAVRNQRTDISKSRAMGLVRGKWAKGFGNRIAGFGFWVSYPPQVEVVDEKNDSIHDLKRGKKNPTP